MKKTRNQKPVSAEPADADSVSPMRMRNPCHPGRILRECMGDMTVTAFAKQIEITYVDLTDILHGKRSISSEVAQKLGQAFPNQDAALWLRLQSSYDRAHDAEFERTVE